MESERFFIDWLLDEMNSRNINISRVAELAGISHSTISNVLSGRQKPGTDFCIGISRAFDIDPNIVLSKAKLKQTIPAGLENTDMSDDEQLLLHHYRHIPIDDQERLLVMARALRREASKNDTPK